MSTNQMTELTPWLVPFGPNVVFDTNRVIREAFGEVGFPAPEQLIAYRQSA